MEKDNVCWTTLVFLNPIFKLAFICLCINRCLDVFILQVSRLLRSSPLLMSSKHDCRWLPVPVRRLTLEWSTASGRSYTRKVSELCGRELEVHTHTHHDTDVITHPYSLTQSSLCVLRSSRVPFVSSVRCDPGDLRAPAAMVLRWLRRTVSADQVKHTFYCMTAENVK